MTFGPLPKAPHPKMLVCSPDVWQTLKTTCAQPAFSTPTQHMEHFPCKRRGPG